MMLPNQRGIASLLILLIVLIVLVAGGVWYFLGSKGNTPIKITAPQLIASPSPTPDSWNTYTNKDYGFEVTYPATGVVINKEGALSIGACGNAIKTNSSASAINNVTVDNFFGIKVLPWDGSIADFMKSKGAVQKYNTNVVNGTGADEAIALNGLR